MPEDIGSLAGGASAMQQAAPRKKLKKQGDYWVDEDTGQQFLDEAGTQPVGSATKAQTAQEFGGMLKENPGKTGSLMTGELNPSAMQQVGGGNVSDVAGPSGMSKQEYEDATRVYESVNDANTLGSRGQWLNKWHDMSEAERQFWMNRTKNKGA